MNPDDYLSDDYLSMERWFGSYYELAIEFYPRGDDARLLRALAAMWASPLLRGPWPEREQLGRAPTPPQRLEVEGSNRLYGLLQLPGALSIGCLSLTVREEHGSDWLDFCLPTGMLQLAFPVRYPMKREDNPWLPAVDQVLLSMAERVYQASPFDMALIGEEASGQLRAQELTAVALARGGVLVPPSLTHQLGSSSAAVALPNGLHWFPWRD